MSREMCRLCLTKVELGPIFQDVQQIEKYKTVLALTTGLNILPNDGLPQKICKECSESVDKSLELRNKSLTSEMVLLSLDFQRIEPTEGFSQEQENKTDKLEEFTTDCFESNAIGFKIEVELDRITQDGDDDLNEEEESVDAKSQEKNKNSRKERREQYLSLVEGDFDPSGPVKCKICKVSVSKWTCFINHAKKHLGFKFMCEFCGKSFISSNQLKRHCRSFHGMKRELKCKHCSYLALDNAQLLVHESREHTGERPFVCDVCAAAYFSRKCLLQHLESHRTDASVQCEQCATWFKSRRHLAKHRYGAHSDKRRERRREKREATKKGTHK